MNCDSCDDPKNAWITAAHRARVDEIVERDLFRIGVDRHALLDQARHAGQTDRELVRDQLADRANAAVAEVIDVVA